MRAWINITNRCPPICLFPHHQLLVHSHHSYLFKEDRYSSTSEEETEADAEVTLINGRNQLNRMFVHNSTTEKPTSTLTTMDNTTQGDPNQVSLSTPPSNMFMSTPTETKFLGTNNFSFQMVATGIYIRSIIKFSTQVTWRMATTHIS